MLFAQRQKLEGIRSLGMARKGELWPRTGSIRLVLMRFALLGADPDSLALVSAAETAGHSIVWCGDLGAPGEPACGGRFDDLGDEWEALVDQSLADAVIVGRGNADASLRGEQVSLLVKSGVAVLTTFPLVDSVLAYYEIDMARGESKTLLQHYNPLTEQRPIIDDCAKWISVGHPELGAIEQVVWERPLAERTQEQVLWHFSRDVELLGLVAERLNRLGALGSPDEAATYAGLSVQLLGRSEVPVRWQVGPVEQAPWPRLVLIAKQGKLSVDFNEAGQAVQLSLSQDGETTTTQFAGVDAAAQSVDRFVDALTNDDQSASTWSQALQAMELTDTIEIALRRGRMIEVHQQQLTEDLAFKGTMSAFGCGVLLVIPPLLLFCGWVAELLGLSLARFWPHALLALLGLFLGIQLIPKLLFPPPES